jgi:hypothetical protein
VEIIMIVVVIHAGIVGVVVIIIQTTIMIMTKWVMVDVAG